MSRSAATRSGSSSCETSRRTDEETEQTEVGGQRSEVRSHGQESAAIGRLRSSVFRPLLRSHSSRAPRDRSRRGEVMPSSCRKVTRTSSRNISSLLRRSPEASRRKDLRWHRLVESVVREDRHEEAKRMGSRSSQHFLADPRLEDNGHRRRTLAQLRGSRRSVDGSRFGRRHKRLQCGGPSRLSNTRHGRGCERNVPGHPCARRMNRANACILGAGLLAPHGIACKQAPTCGFALLRTKLPQQAARSSPRVYRGAGRLGKILRACDRIGTASSAARRAWRRASRCRNPRCEASLASRPSWRRASR